MSQSKKVEDYYDFLAQHYDGATKGKFTWTSPQEASHLIIPKLKRDSSVLDIGIGTGQSADYLTKIGCKVCGIDISEKMLEITRSKFPQFELYKADLNSNLSVFNGRLFDTILALGVLEFVTDLPTLAERLATLLQDGGYFCFTFEELVEDHKLQSSRESSSGTGTIGPNISLEFLHHRYSKTEIDLLLSHNGFKTLEAKRFQAYLKTAEMIPIYYWIILAQKTNSAAE